jgi:hypothetical protein
MYFVEPIKKIQRQHHAKLPKLILYASGSARGGSSDDASTASAEVTHSSSLPPPSPISSPSPTLAMAHHVASPGARYTPPQRVSMHLFFKGQQIIFPFFYFTGNYHNCVDLFMEKNEFE